MPGKGGYVYNVTCYTWHVTRDTYRTLALEHECIGDELLSVRLGVAEVVGAVAVEHLLPLLDGVLGDEVGLDKDGVMSSDNIAISSQCYPVSSVDPERVGSTRVVEQQQMRVDGGPDIHQRQPLAGLDPPVRSVHP